MLTFTSEAAFRAAFPASAQFIKANAPDAPCIGVQVVAGVADVSKAGWVQPWADITNPIVAGKKLVLVNLPDEGCYACEVASNASPVGYRPRAIELQNLGPVTAYKTRTPASPLLAFPVTSGVVRYKGVEVGPGQVIFARLQDGTIGVVDQAKLSGMTPDDSGLFAGSSAIAYDSEPVWATEPLEADYEYEGLEGVKRAPATARLAFSDTKNLYFIMPDKWTKMGYAPVV